MRKLDFYNLPRAIQDRFIESSQGVAAPAAIVVAAHSEKGSILWAAAAIVFAGAWAGFTTLGFGDLGSSLAIGGMLQKLVHVVFAIGVVACALRAYLITWSIGRLPYGTGDFLFPSGVITANGAGLIEHDGTELTSIAASGSTVQVKFNDGTSFSFSCADSEAAQTVVGNFEAGAEKWKSTPESETLERARLNPLMESGVPNPLAPTQAHARPALLPLPILAGIVLVMAVGLGLSISGWRDTKSRAALYNAAREADTVEAYQAYLDRGGDKEEVATLLLPRAELKQAVEKGTVEAIEQFKEKNPDLQIGGEVQNALRAGLLRELDAAKAKGTLTAIEGVPKRFKAHALIAAEIAAARRAVYAKAMADFQKQASLTQPELIPFVQALLTYAQTKGPRVELRFEHEFPQNPKMLDKIVSKSKKYYMGQKSLPTQYFLGKDARRREDALLKQLQERLQKAFAKDILTFELAAAAKGENEELPEIQVPTITFTHRERLSGGFVGGKPKAMYLGAAVMIAGKGEIPGDEKNLLVFRWNAWRAPDFSVLSDRKKDIPDVYEVMMGGAFDKFRGIYLERWFAKP